MEIEINVTYARTQKVQVPAELAPSAEWVYPNREKFDEWVASQADELSKDPEQPDWVSTEAFDTETWCSVYEIG